MSGVGKSVFPPVWAPEVLACPRCTANLSSNLKCTHCGNAGKWVEGIACFNIAEQDTSIAWYKAKGGSNFLRRLDTPFTMSSLDTFVYHGYLAELKPPKSDAIIVDVGAGDGRNTLPWLKWGYQRVIALDPIFVSLARLRDHVAKEAPQWAEHVLLVQSDARELPMRDGMADVVLAVEVLHHLNEAYDQGLGECARVLRQGGRMLLSEAACEGAYLTSLLYGGIADMLQIRGDPACYEKAPDGSVLRSRSFAEDELRAAVEKAGLAPLGQQGISCLSTVMGYLRGQGKLSADDERLFPAVCEFLRYMGTTPYLRRTHVVTAEKS
jgi:ubiquinone/menaquinone biosynthesis C-methylase UbiE